MAGQGQATLGGAARIRFDARILDASRLPDIEGWKQALVTVAEPFLNSVTLHGTITKAPGKDAQIAVAPSVPGGAAVARRAQQTIGKLPGAVEKVIPRDLGRKTFGRFRK